MLEDVEAVMPERQFVQDRQVPRGEDDGEDGERGKRAREPPADRPNGRAAQGGCQEPPGDTEEEQGRGHERQQQVLEHVDAHERAVGEIVDRSVQGDEDGPQPGEEERDPPPLDAVG
ncbi:MAG: hypothetical protein A3G97_15660 [Candidatus Rokubacteria bacterium RIFCSPLOWO2_12_FULL_69_21]|nr:MAG: hypothetical protein A3G97_15660 [Candidatus Rokubacteria bacterium RIFCSPLOWO2_12_FULL_69_21]